MKCSHACEKCEKNDLCPSIWMQVCSPFFWGSNVPMQVFARPILKVQPAFFVVFLLGGSGTLDSPDEVSRTITSQDPQIKLRRSFQMFREDGDSFCHLPSQYLDDVRSPTFFRCFKPKHPSNMSQPSQQRKKGELCGILQGFSSS